MTLFPERRAAHGGLPAGARPFSVVREVRQRRRRFGLRGSRLGLVPCPHPGPSTRQLRSDEDAGAEIFEPDPRFFTRLGVSSPGMGGEGWEYGREERRSDAIRLR